MSYITKSVAFVTRSQSHVTQSCDMEKDIKDSEIDQMILYSMFIVY